MHVTDAGWVFLYVYVYIHDLAIESFIFILIYYSDSLLFSDFLSYLMGFTGFLIQKKSFTLGI